MAKIVEINGNKVIKLTNIYDRIAFIQRRDLIEVDYKITADPKGRNRSCLLPLNNNVSIFDTKEQLNNLSHELYRAANTKK